MKRLFLLLSIIFISAYAFSENFNTPAFMVEVNGGYAVGVNLDNAGYFDTRLYYPFGKFGLAFEAGGLFADNSSMLHFLIGPMVYFFNNNKWRVPLILGFDIMNGKTGYFGVGIIAAVHRSFTDHFYMGFNIGITYAFDNIYEEITGYRTTTTRFDDGTSKTQTTPVLENRSHYGNYVYFKPSLVIGFQY
jgi:hypothetical protein